MDFQRRIMLYAFGVIIGGGASYLFFGDRITNMKWTPSERIKLRLESTLVRATESAEMAMQAWPTDLEGIKRSISTADVNVSGTERKGDSLFYDLKVVVAGRPAQLIFLVSSDLAVDTTATLWELSAR